MTSDDFKHDAAAAMKPAAEGPVVITDGGVPSYVLLSYDRYLQMGGAAVDVVALLSLAEGADIDFEPPKAGIEPKSGELS